jgi:hypothetical protein
VWLTPTSHKRKPSALVFRVQLPPGWRALLQLLVKFSLAQNHAFLFTSGADVPKSALFSKYFHGILD